METLQGLLNDRNLKEFAGASIYSRGETYFRSERVQVRYADEQEAECIVRGTSYYTVTLWLHKDKDLGASCTCPYAANGWFCKHMVAGGLAVADYLEFYGEVLWRPRLDVLMEGLLKKSRRRLSPYWLFISLQRQSYGWRLQPHHLWIDQIPKGVLPDVPSDLVTQLPELVKHNQWILKKIKSNNSGYRGEGCVNGGDQDVAFANLLIQQNKQNENQYYYYQNDPYKLAYLLPILTRSEIPLYLGDYRNPIRAHLHLLEKPVRLNLEMGRSEAGLRLSAALRNGNQVLDLTTDRAEVMTTGDHPWVMAGDQVFRFQSNVDVEYLSPWLQNPILDIPSDQEDQFLEDYFPALAEQIPIEGPDITWEDVHGEPTKRLYLTDDPSSDSIKRNGEMLAYLRFGYGEFEVSYQKDCPQVSVRRKPGSWTLLRIYRDQSAEEQIWGDVSSARHGLKRSGKGYGDNVFLLRSRVHPIDFLMRHVPRLTESGFEIYGEEKLKSARVNRNKPTLSLNVSSGIDWFDLQAVVTFGDVEAALSEVRKALKKKERYIKLADGTIGEIPDEWLLRYRHLFGLGEQMEDGVRLENHHLAVLDQLLADVDKAQVDPEFHRRKKQLLDFEGIQSRNLPAGFDGELRPYQKAGFNWLHFLHDYNFGGCLADDMGLGKTVEALVFLQSLKEIGHGEKPSLLVLPRSLLVNWQREAERFTPDLNCYEYFGKQRIDDDIECFDNYDLVLTTYGVMLRDIEKLRGYRFHYAILDESQAIKNPLAKTSKAARLLNTDHRLALTGTPVENSSFELWSQFAFLNPGLLGNLEYFKKEFGNPIERQGDETVSQYLRNMVYPFILRRTKEQVAPELPPRTERIIYADMEPAQRNLYDKTRDYYRAMLLGVIEEEGMNHARMKVLEGLLRLRQISNHPRLVKKEFRGTSAKFELLLETLETLRSTGHKALVFSQFVKMLKILREEMELRKMPYVYLDGRTRKRQEQVDTFQDIPEIPFFLISLKAGGVGLNLTAADYVIHIDPWWNPAVEMQATDRTHRIGQDKPVFVYKLITRGSVEEKILQLQDQKKALVEQLITTESSFFKNLTAEDVGVLFG